MTSPSELAAHLLSRLQIQGKPDLLQIAQRIGLRIREVNAEAFEGSLVRALDGPKGIIAINIAIREFTRKRFTIAHEIGHYVIPSHRRLENTCTNNMVETWRENLNRPELEANEFAVELLLPAGSVREGLRLNDPSLHTIAKVANQFETSLTATTLRFIGLTALPCVAVWSEGKHTKWYRRSDTFALYLPKEILPCEGSFAFNLSEGGSAPNDIAEVPPESWLDSRDADKVVRAYEHSLRLPYYDATLTLLCFELRSPPDDEDMPTLDDLDPDAFTLKRKRWPR